MPQYKRRPPLPRTGSEVTWPCCKSDTNATTHKLVQHKVSIKGNTHTIITKNENNVRNKPQKDINILLWESPERNYLKKGIYEDNKKSLHGKCKYDNCLITRATGQIQSFKSFDAILFELSGNNNYSGQRYLHQKFIVMYEESSTNYPATNKDFNSFFNWTMSYRLDADIRVPYFKIYNKSGYLIGPDEKIQWLKKMDPVSDKVKRKLQSKNKLAAIFMSFCGYQESFEVRGRLKYLDKLRSHLRHYGFDVDVYGECGNLSCPRHKPELCDGMLQRNYFFYLAFENSRAKDYVTEKVLRAISHYTVPIVYGGADYIKFLPPGSYLNACQYEPAQLASRMVRIMTNMTEYTEFFRYKNHYMFKKGDKGMCPLCTAMNSESRKKYSSNADFIRWYNAKFLICRPKNVIRKI